MIKKKLVLNSDYLLTWILETLFTIYIVRVTSTPNFTAIIHLDLAVVNSIIVILIIKMITMVIR
jgi:hypothetical protein